MMMRRMVISAVMVACAGFLHGGSADKFTARQVFDRMLKAQDEQQIIRCDMIKEDRMDGTDLAQSATVTKGRLLMKKGGKAVLEITDPVSQKVVSDGKTLWMELPDAAQVMKYDVTMMRETCNFFLDLPASIRYYAKKSLKRLIAPGEAYRDKPVSALELDPDDPEKAGFTKMQVWVDHQKWVIVKILLHTQGMQISVAFENSEVVRTAQIKKNPKLNVSNSQFNYKVPEGFQVFDLMAQ